MSKLICFLFFLTISCTSVSLEAQTQEGRCLRASSMVARLERRIIELRDRPVQDALDIEIDRMQIELLTRLRLNGESFIRAACVV